MPGRFVVIFLIVVVAGSGLGLININAFKLKCIDYLQFLNLAVIEIVQALRR